MGCILLAFLANDVGIIYGGRTTYEMVDGEEVKTIGGFELLGV